MIDTELPGLWVTTPIRNMLNYGENIRSAISSVAASQVTRDVFPSGHTEISLLSILLGFKYRSKYRWVIFVFGSGLIISTVLLRYHYVIDVITGSLLAIITLYTAEPLARAFRSLKKRLVTKINAAQ
jgi:membrane-associated phospholipid phosphatase